VKEETLLIIDSSEQNADLLYRTGFFIPDPAIFVEHRKKKMLFLSDLELERARKEARVDMVFPLSEYRKRISPKRRSKAGFTDIVDLIFKEYGIKRAVVPGRFPLRYADELRKLGYKITYKKKEPFFEERLKKTPREVGYIREALRKTARAMGIAIEMIASSEIRKGRLFLGGKELTSERIKGEVNAELSRMGYVASHTIVACGVHSSMPHHSGEGPIFVNQPIVIDIFPRSQKNGYFGDMTRTVVKGTPSVELKRMYRAVLKGQRLAISLIRDGVKAKEVHQAVVELFKKLGFETGNIDGKQQGFIHSTGHGLGLEIHEPPRIGPGDDILREGNVVTVEPGLYYERLGGIRIEDVVVVKKDGCVNLTRYPKVFRV
jgi:Xaa-Pro aminopeptidase